MINSLFFFTFVLSFSLALKAAIDLFFQKGPFTKKLQKLLGVILFTIAFYAQFHYKLQHNLLDFPLKDYLIGGILSLLCLIPKPSMFKTFFLTHWIKVLIYIFIALITLFALFLSAYNTYSVGKPILTIQIPGESRQKKLTYVFNGDLCTSIVNEHKVLIEDLSKKPLCQEYLYGDLVGVRVRTLHFPKILQLIGFEPCFRLDMLYNGYIEHSAYAKYPLQAIPLENKTWLQGPIEKLLNASWSHHYYSTNSLMTAALQSQYFPLTSKNNTPFKGSFELSLYSSGISGKALK